MSDRDSRLRPNRETEFCERMIEKLKNKNVQNNPEVLCGSQVRKPKTDRKAVGAKCVSKTLVDRLFAENMVRDMKNINKRELHDPNLCAECRVAEGRIHKKQFLRSKINMLENPLVDRRVEEFLLKENTVTMVGEIAALLPKPMDDRHEIWQRFMKHSVS